jgi:hypothetical protein
MNCSHVCNTLLLTESVTWHSPTLCHFENIPTSPQQLSILDSHSRTRRFSDPALLTQNSAILLHPELVTATPYIFIGPILMASISFLIFQTYVFQEAFSYNSDTQVYSF